MRRLACLGVLAVFGSMMVAVAGAQEDAKAPPVTPPGATPNVTPPAESKGPAAKEFNRQFDDWRAVLKELRRLKVQYQTAALADQAKIQQEWKEQVEKGNVALAALEGAGLKAERAGVGVFEGLSVTACGTTFLLTEGK